MVQMFNKLGILQKNEFISKAIDYAGVGVVITDPSQTDNPIIYVNSGFEEITGYKASEIIGTNCRFLQGDRGDNIKRKEIRQSIQANKTIHTPLLNYKKDGTPFWNDLNIYPVHIEELDKLFFIGIQKDITEQIEAEDQAKKQMLDIRKLSIPIIPIFENIAVLPLIGELDEQRQQQLLEEAGSYAEREQKDYIILDLSGIEKFDERIHWTIHSLKSMLDLMGCQLILTGITPELAMASKDSYGDLSDVLTFSTVERAIKHLQSKQ